MKILYICEEFPPINSGGAGVVAFEFAKQLQKMGHRIFVISSVQKRDLEGSTEIDNMTVYRIYSDYPFYYFLRAYVSLYNPLAIPKIKKIIGDVKPDVCHIHIVHSYLSYHTFKLAKYAGCKVFFTAHDVMAVSYGKASFLDEADNYKIKVWEQIRIAGKGYNPLRNIIIKHYLKFADKIFTVSDALKRVLEDNGVNNIETIHNGINLEEWVYSEPKISDFKRRLGIGDKKIIFFGGRLSGAKGGEQILKALEIINRSDIVLLIAGKKDKYFKKMEALAKNLGVSDKIIFAGWLDREEIKIAFFSSDVCVTPSIYFDPFNLFNIESMAAGKPVVGTCFGGTPEIVKDGETGYIVNPLDHKLLAEKIIDLLNNPEKSRQFGEAGYKRVQEDFNLKKQTDKLLNFYETFFPRRRGYNQDWETGDLLSRKKFNYDLKNS